MSPLYSDEMTKEEVMKEAARILAPTLRRMYFERFGNEAVEKDEKKEKEQKEKGKQNVEDDKLKNP
ncbi:MAG: hypothetical protein IPM14_02055 [bacterium]|nr:hypothetical protein [bacterium]